MGIASFFSFPQLLEFTRFRLTSPFRLTYTHFIGTGGIDTVPRSSAMTILARIVRFLFWLLVLSWGVWLLRRVFGSLLENAGASPQQHTNSAGEAQGRKLTRRLVRDPVCGMYVDETLSIPMREGDELVHFCSIACRDAYVVGSKKFAASG
jgi:hypothetical protein